MNVLLLSVGRRVELTKIIKKSVNGIGGQLYCADANSLAPALYFSDSYFLLPRVESIEYLDVLISCIIQYNISVVIPTIDTELAILSINKNLIETKTNARVIISSHEVIKLFSNKELSSHKFNELGFDSPQIINEEGIVFPVFVKPKFGSSSIGAQKIDSFIELQVLQYKFGEIIIQELIDGDEYTIDCLVDFQGKPIHIVPRLRIATRSGEVLKGRITKDSVLISLVKDFLSKISFMGPITIQIIKKEDKYYFIEVNPRFGGGVPMSINAGASIVDDLLSIASGDFLQYKEDYRDNVTFLRFDQSIELPADHD